MTQDTARRVLEIESQAIRDLVPRIGPAFEKAVKMILEGRGRVVVTGMGKSGIIGQKISATLSSTGTPAVFMHPADAIHRQRTTTVLGDRPAASCPFCSTSVRISRVHFAVDARAVVREEELLEGRFSAQQLVHARRSKDL